MAALAEPAVGSIVRISQNEPFQIELTGVYDSYWDDPESGGRRYAIFRFNVRDGQLQPDEYPYSTEGPVQQIVQLGEDLATWSAAVGNPVAMIAEEERRNRLNAQIWQGQRWPAIYGNDENEVKKE